MATTPIYYVKRIFTDILVQRTGWTADMWALSDFFEAMLGARRELGLQDDPADFAARLHLTPERYAEAQAALIRVGDIKLIPIVKAMGPRVTDIRQPRTERSLSDTQAIYEAKAANARKSAEKRRLKREAEQNAKKPNGLDKGDEVK